jgi:hypothetical protein
MIKLSLGLLLKDALHLDIPDESGTSFGTACNRVI